jgi:dTDP-4-dehydrorhamnose 3,5-epimerase
MIVEDLSLTGLKVVKPRIFEDDRGFLVETYREDRYREAGIDVRFVQDNHSRSRRGTLRGLHFQTSPGQAKLIRVVSGEIFDVAVDIRPDSDTFGRWESVRLDARKHHQFYVPVGFAHGFCVLSEAADILYKVSTFYDSTTESGFRWDDAEVAVRWPIETPVVSRRDADAMSFADLRRLLGARGAR